jgi:predicted ATPase/DNA-binding winged helix-turn-helix (wHTH) protein
MKYFLSYRFDRRHGTLWRGTRQIEITRKAAGVLRCLVDASGALVPHDEILSCVWPDTHVQPENVKVLVRELRRALGDDAHDPQFIRSEPGRGYAFLAPVSDAPVPVATPRRVTGSSIFINRHDELARLKDVLAEVVSGECRLVLLEGERGTGRTALCDAFLQYASGLPSVRTCYGQCVEHADPSEAYLPVVDAIHHLVRQFPSAMPQMLARYAPGWLAQLPPWVADLAVPHRTGRRPEPTRLIGELSVLLETLASECTSVIVLEDLHWGDFDTLELLRALARRHAPLRTLILATYAPHATTVASTVVRNLAAELRASARCVPLSVGPLCEDDVREYLAARFGRGPVEALARTLHRVTGGVPLSLVAAADGLVAADCVASSDQSYRLRYSPRTIEGSLPRELLDVVLWRFQQLGPKDRATLEMAAVVGVEFSAGQIAVAGELETVAEVKQRLAQLLERGFIGRRGLGRVGAEDTVFRFLHPAHADVLAAHAPPVQQIRAAERIANAQRSGERFA